MKALQNKQLIILIIAVIILLLGVGGVFIMSQAKNQNPGAASTVADEINEETTSSSTTQDIVKIIKEGKNMQCNFNYADDKSSTAGVFYVSGTNMRGDITTRSDEKGEETDLYMVRKGNESYIWGGTLPMNMGMKMSVDLDEFATNNDRTSQYFSDERADYDCKPWEVDQTAFEIPNTVKFQDFSQMMQGLQQ